VLGMGLGSCGGEGVLGCGGEGMKR
jgi:hypothetical protein